MYGCLRSCFPGRRESCALKFPEAHGTHTAKCRLLFSGGYHIARSCLRCTAAQQALT
ncbi:MAG: hypothetical protein IJC34_06680 [Lentisphaeria bacterium]|nr:hypothetical protein [Lentisphaeria bacterium]